MTRWFTENWFDIFSAVGIVGGLWFTAFSLYWEAKTRRIANMLTITANYRELWKEFFRSAALTRIIDPLVDLARLPPTQTEELFVTLVISQMSSVYYATKDDLLIILEGSRRDIAEFLSLPIPNAVWNKNKAFQNSEFVAFVESCRKPQ